MKKELSIIAVVIDNLEVTQRFVSSIRQYTNKTDYELILIDNGSKDKKAIQYFKKASDVYYRFNKRTDLAKAWNKGIEISKGKFVAVVNNDTVVSKDWFKPLKETLTKHKKAGMVSPITFWLIAGYFKWDNLKKFDKTFSKPFKLIKFKEVVLGEFCLFKKSVLKKIGGYNEIYKLSASDLEICFELYKKGYDIWVDSRVFVFHEGGATRFKIMPKKWKNIYAKEFKLFKSRWPKYAKEWK